MPHRWLARARPGDAGRASRAGHRLRGAAVLGQQPRPGGAAAHAGTQPRPARHAARGRARAGARGPRGHLRAQPGQPVGHAPVACAPVSAAGLRRAVPARRGRLHRLPAHARLAAPAELRGRVGQLRHLPAGGAQRGLARALPLVRQRRRALVADLRRGLFPGGGQARARHAAAERRLAPRRPQRASAPVPIAGQLHRDTARSTDRRQRQGNGS